MLVGMWEHMLGGRCDDSSSARKQNKSRRVPTTRPAAPKPVIADAEAAFASAGLRTPDAVADCLVCWDFMATFRAAAASFHVSMMDVGGLVSTQTISRR